VHNCQDSSKIGLRKVFSIACLFNPSRRRVIAIINNLRLLPWQVFPPGTAGSFQTTLLSLTAIPNLAANYSWDDV
jgi:hypothetical protein